MYTSLHNHTDYSNASLGFTDSIIKYNQLIQKAYDLGLKGIALTEHECVSSAIKAFKYYTTMQKDRDFKLILGNEIYLLSEEEDSYMRGEQDVDTECETKYYHFLLNAVNNVGHKQIRQLSSKAWERAYTYKGLMRRPTYYSDLEEIIRPQQGNVIASSACMGSVIDTAILNNDLEKAQNAILYFDDLFGHNNFFLEIQPCTSNNAEQIKVNQTLWQFSQSLNIPIICTTDSHYLSKDQVLAHKVLLNSKDGGDARETEDFYETTYLMGADELRDYLSITFDDSQIDIIFANTNSIADRIEGYEFEHAPMIPMIPIEKIPKFQKTDRYKEYYDKYKDFGYYANINAENAVYSKQLDNRDVLIYQDQYFFYRIEEALYDLLQNEPITHYYNSDGEYVEYVRNIEIYIDRLNKEMEQLKLLSESFDSSMASYYTNMSKDIEIIWESDSISEVSRGSGLGYVICYLLGIVQIDPIPLGDYACYWRHNHIERGREVPD